MFGLELPITSMGFSLKAGSAGSEGRHARVHFLLHDKRVQHRLVDGLQSVAQPGHCSRHGSYGRLAAPCHGVPGLRPYQNYTPCQTEPRISVPITGQIPDKATVSVGTESQPIPAPITPQPRRESRPRARPRTRIRSA